MSELHRASNPQKFGAINGEQHGSDALKAMKAARSFNDDYQLPANQHPKEKC